MTKLDETTGIEGVGSTVGLEREFESWWESEGQFCRAGGGQYEKTFAYRAWMYLGTRESSNKSI